MTKFLIFAGTTEGRELIHILSAAKTRETDGGTAKGQAPELFACVATEYGRVLLEEKGGNVNILSGRLSQTEMATLMEEHRFDAVVDTTHPYAAVVTECIQKACAQTATPYLRLLRQKGSYLGNGAPVFVESSEEAAEFLNRTEGSVLLTTGSKELAAFTRVKDYQNRLFARVLPMAEVVEKCAQLGFQGRQLICMQGPFSYEMNCAMLKETGAKYLVTKDSGKPGGFDEKLWAAEDLGVCPVIIGRKQEETGKSFAEVLERLAGDYGLELPAELPSELPQGALRKEPEQVSHWFPLFVNMQGKKVTVIGAGAIARRRIQTLLQFSCTVTVIAPEASGAVKEAAASGKLTLLEKGYDTGDLFVPGRAPGADYVLAATNCRACNHQVFADCRRWGVTVNVADCKEECDFYFPGVIRRGDLVVGVTAGGKDHGLVKAAAKKIRAALDEPESREAEE